MKGAKTPLLTKNELALLLGGLIVLGSAFVTNKGSKDSSNQHEMLVLKSKEDKPFESFQVKKVTTRKPAQIKKDTDLSTEETLTPFVKLKAAEDCIKSNACDLPNSDPRAYGLAAYSQLAKEIDGNRDFLIQNWDSNIKEDFKRYLKYSNGFVKEEALKTILELDERELSDFADEFAIDVIHDHNAKLMDLTMEFINKLEDTDLRAQIETEWIQAMITGSPNKSEALARYSHKLINGSNLLEFKRALDKLPPASPERTYLETSVREFEMTQIGG